LSASLEAVRMSLWASVHGLVLIGAIPIPAFTLGDSRECLWWGAPVEGA
jgi:hypothetical protein